MSWKALGLACVAASLLAGCGIFDNDRWGGNDPDKLKRDADPYHTDPQYSSDIDPTGRRYASNAPQGPQQGLFASFFGGGGPQGNGQGVTGVGVNSYLWRATLDTVSFMPLASADPFGGVIITDWYSPPDQLNDRFKVNIFILSRELRADGVRATVFRQKRDPQGQWADAPVDQATGTDLENAILTRARQMRLSTASQ